MFFQMATLAIFKKCHLKNFFYLLTVLGLYCCLRAFFHSCNEQGYILVAVHKLLIVVASLFVVHGLPCPMACGIFPDQGLNLCPLAGLTTGPPGKSLE